MKKEIEKQGSTRANKILLRYYKATHYATYHAYRKGLTRATRLIELAILILMISTIISIIPATRGLADYLLSLSGLIGVIYFLVYYRINAKGRYLRKDSKKAMRMIATDGYVPKSWNIYDGVYSSEGLESIEIAFVQDHSYLKDIWRILKDNRPILPPTKRDLEALREYILRLQQLELQDELGIQINYIAYGTLDGQLVKQLKEAHFKLEEIDDDFITKPGRLDYGAATGTIKNAFRNYPKDFKAYIISFDFHTYLKLQDEKKHQDKLRARRRTRLNSLASSEAK